MGNVMRRNMSRFSWTWLELSTGAVQPHPLLYLSLLPLRLLEKEKLFI